MDATMGRKRGGRECHLPAPTGRLPWLEAHKICAPARMPPPAGALAVTDP